MLVTKKSKKDIFGGRRVRGVCLTDYDTSGWEELPNGVTYLAWAQETCPTTGRLHLQGFAYAQVAQRATFWQKIFKGAHLEEMHGTFRDNEKYCSKEGQLQELGIKPMENGKQHARHEVVQLMHEGHRPVEIAQMAPHLYETCARYNAFNKELFNHIERQRHLEEGYKKRVVIFKIGKSDQGKSRSIRDECGYANVFVAPDNFGKWFDGYKGESVVLFDDVCPSSIMSVTNFLRLADGYPIQVPVKGGFVNWHPDTLVFTSNIEWTKWWPNLHLEPDHLAAVKRRITDIEVFKEDGSIEFDPEFDSWNK